MRGLTGLALAVVHDVRRVDGYWSWRGRTEVVIEGSEGQGREKSWGRETARRPPEALRDRSPEK